MTFTFDFWLLSATFCIAAFKVKGALGSFGEEIQSQNFSRYNINSDIFIITITEQTSCSHREHRTLLEARKAAGSA